MWKSRGLVVCVLIAGLLLAALTACQQGGGATQAAQSVETGKAHLEAGRYTEAIAALEAAVAADPNNSEAHFLLGQAYNRVGDPLFLSKAEAEFKKVIELDPKNAAAHHNLGVTYYQLQNIDAAVQEFQAALELDPDDPDTHYQLGAAYLVMSLSATDPTAPPDPEMLKQAVAEFQKALELEPDKPEALIGLGNVYLQQGDYPAAVEALEKAIEHAPDSPEAYYALGGAYAQMGEQQKACETFGRFVELNPPAAWKAQGEQLIAALGCQ